MKRGIRQISGNLTPAIGKDYTYKVTSLYSGTNSLQDNDVKWILYKKQPGGQWKKVNGPVKRGMQVTYSFGQIASGHEFLLEAYAYEAEGKAPPGLIIKPQQGPPKINKAEILDAGGNALSAKPHFLDTVTLKVTTENMVGRAVTLSLWEDDTFGDDLLWGKQTFKIGNKNGIVSHRIQLSTVMRDKGGSFLDEGWEQEVYLLAEAAKAKSSSSATTNIVIESRQANTTAEGGVYKPQKPQTGNAPAGIGVVKTRKGSSVCACMTSGLIWGGKVNCEFRKKVLAISTRQGVDANNLMAAIAHETGGTFDPTCGTFKSHKDEKKEGYVGLLQIGKDAASDIGVTRTELLKMDRLKQLDYVEKYLSLPLVKGKLNTLTDFYLAVLFPVDCGKGNQPNHVVFDNSLPITYKANGDPVKNLNYWRNKGYAANKPFLKEGKKEKGKTYVWEIAANIEKWYDLGEKHKATEFTCQAASPNNVFDAKDLITYRIYSDGRIERHIPQTIKQGYETKYKYVYHDEDGERHDLGIYKVKRTQVYGGTKGTFVNLINLDDVTKTYKKGTYQYTFNVDSPRKYVNEKTLASFFGAMLEVNFNDISCNGFSHADGSSRPSISHINGNNGDFKYLRKDKKLMFGEGTSLDIRANPSMLDDVRQNRWNEALYKFGWKSMMGWSYKRDGKVNYLKYLPKNSDNHHHHLHLQCYKPNFKEIKA